ncbi:amidohydrolase family protein [Alteromonas sp. ASW11-36]|uniref:Amidohydrolase family protein n=1 Tax=Alteromonas arenosi TaxID=3055817 RepID=A0ABT7SW08_9ALTE|nr:amidohydrolase family protein [Alteromonas sp. ASW11-36]MDM7860383.1 amidohydrolase family protein [Alteromonas sp. ASW11-36]
MNKKILAIGAMLLSSIAAAQQTAIVGGTVHTMGPMGTVENGAVLINDGKIVSVVSADAVPSSYTQVNATGKIVTPGLFGALTSLGLVEVGMSAGSVDSSVVHGEERENPVSSVGAALDVQYGFNPDSTLIPISRVEGVTAAATGISYGDYMFNGQGAVASLSGEFDSLIRANAFMHVDVSSNVSDSHGGSRAALWVAIEQSFAEAASIRQVTGFAAYMPRMEWHGMTTRPDAEALLHVLNGKMPLLFTADRAADIMQVVAFKKRNPTVDVVLVNAVEGWRVAEALAEARIPVILNPENNLPGGFDQIGATLTNAARLHQAGVQVSIGMETHNIRLATQHAGNAVANGLPWQAGLASLTINPARIYGVDELLGSLEPGKQADVVIWSGDPLEVTSHAEAVFIEGEQMSTDTRQHKLRDRYMNLNSDKPMTHVRP